MSYLSKEQQVRTKRPYKKKSNKKKPKPNGKTPIPTGAKICACGCGHTKYLSVHHVYGKSARRYSNKYNCTEWLCYESHQSSYGIHGSKHPNIDLDYKLKIKHQERLLNEGMTLKEFIFYFGMDYISMGLEGYRKYRKKVG